MFFLQLKDFIAMNKDKLESATRTVQQAVEQAEENIKWLDNNYATIRDWLQRNTA